MLYSSKNWLVTLAQIEPTRNCRIGLAMPGYRRRAIFARIDIVRNGAMLTTFGPPKNGLSQWRDTMKIICDVAGRLSSIPAVQLIKEMALALGIAITVEGVASITDWGLTLLGGAPWPAR